MSLYIFNKLKTELFSITTCRNYLVAFSGGIDSCILLQLLKVLQKHTSIRVRAIYLNHSVSARSHYWLHRCEEICENLSIPLITVNILQDIGWRKLSESDLSIARYQIFSKHLLKKEVLLTAHTKDDHIESILLQLIRGSGTRGITGMPASRIISGKIQKRDFLYLHIRPLLTISRTNILNYARLHAIKWIEDESNFSDIFSRNYIRIHIIPVIKSRWGYKFVDALSRTSNFCIKAELVFFKVTEFNFYYVSSNSSFSTDTAFRPIPGVFSRVLSVKRLVKLDQRSRLQVLCYWLKKYRCHIPDIKELSILENMLTFNNTKNFPNLFIIGNYIIKRSGNFLLLKIREYPNVFARHSVSYLWDKWRLHLCMRDEKILNLSLILGLNIAFCRRHHLDKTTSPLKKKLSFLGLPNSVKKNTPLIVDKDNNLLGVVGYTSFV